MWLVWLGSTFIQCQPSLPTVHSHISQQQRKDWLMADFDAIPSLHIPYVSPCSAPSSVTAVEFVFLFLTVIAYPCKPVLWTCDSYSPVDHSTTYNMADDLPVEESLFSVFLCFPILLNYHIFLYPLLV